MSVWRQLKHGFRVLTDRRASDQAITNEAQDFIDRTMEEFIARGLSPEDARRAARIECGSAFNIRDDVRGHGWENTVEALIADLRYAGRRMRAAPGFTALTVFTLALGIGATAAIFSVVKPILIEPLPYPNASRIVTIWGTRRDGGRNEVAFGTVNEISQKTRSFDSLAAIRGWQPTMTSAGAPERFQGQRVSASYFRTLGVAPAIGQDFRKEDDLGNGPHVALLSDALWHRRFAGDAAVIGSSITLDGQAYTVIGIMPARFENVAAPDAEIWAPLQYDMSQGGRVWGHHLRLVARLRDGIGIDQASKELNIFWPAFLMEHPKDLFNDGLAVLSLQDALTSGVRPALNVIIVSVLLVLLIACVNVTHLLLARGSRRRGEFAVRTALGAGRARMIRQLLTESVLLAAFGGALGIFFAEAGAQALVALSPPSLPRVGNIAIDGSVLAFSVVVTTLVGFGFGLFPAFQASRQLQAGLTRQSRSVAGGHRRMRSTLVVAEVSFAFVLLVSAGLLLRSMERLIEISPGLRTANLLTMQVQTSGLRFREAAVTYAFFDRALEAARHVPGITSAAFTSQLPISGDSEAYGVSLESNPDQKDVEIRSAFRYAVSPSYFNTTGIPLLRGRLLDEEDRAGGPLVAVVSDSLARHRFHGTEAIGKRVRIGPLDGPLYTIVGVVGDIKQLSLLDTEPDAIYTTPTQWRFSDNMMTLVVSAQGNAAALAPALRMAIWSVDKNQPIVRVATMDQLLARSVAERRFVMILVTAFAVVALLLAAAGVYGVLSGSVAERIREIGVRSALGATPRSILGLVLRQGVTLTLLGTVIGITAAAAGTRALTTLLFGVSHLDVVTYVGVCLLLLAFSAAACWVPAWRASRVDPGITLRSE